mgnify:FL=1
MTNRRTDHLPTETVRNMPIAPLGRAEEERSRFSPAPLAGVEPLPDHVVDPDEVEESIDAALVAAEEDEQGSGTVHTEPPELVAATLGDSRGLGVLRLVWGSDGDVIDTMGSLREMETTGDREGVVAGQRSRFIGSLYLGEGNSVPIDTEVIVSGRGEYVDVNGERVSLVKFTAPALLGDERFALREKAR